MRKKRYCMLLATMILLGQIIIPNPSKVYSASVARVQSQMLQDNNIGSSITEGSNTDVVPTTPENPQPITPTMPPLVPEKPDITLPPVTIGEPVPITPTVPIKPDNTLPLVTVGEPVPIIPTAPPITPEQPDISLPTVSPTTPVTEETPVSEVTTVKSQDTNNRTTNSQDKKVETETATTEAKDRAVKTSAQEEVLRLPHTGIETNVSWTPQYFSTNSAVNADKKAKERKHTIAVHAAGTGGVVTGVGTSVLLLGILKKASWLKQFLGK
ncbi:hypothetical protein ET007_04295 [Lactococcus garvieae]|nr:hypothetical protein [Lactococcus garvieae]NHJ17492.1 hypothetical protein [Lactococcus garvieae]